MKTIELTDEEIEMIRSCIQFTMTELFYDQEFDEMDPSDKEFIFKHRNLSDKLKY
jgi:hypothetical protein